MSITTTIREQVRQRADFACEYCGVSETDAGGQLTIDHFRPIAKEGDDSYDNLIYCCVRCNQYKLDFWSAVPTAPRLWNPRNDPISQHFFELDDGILLPTTEVGAFTLRRLRLNRRPLVMHRLRERQLAREARLLIHYRELARTTHQLLTQQSVLLEGQQRLLERQQELLRLIVNRRK